MLCQVFSQLATPLFVLLAEVKTLRSGEIVSRIAKGEEGVAYGGELYPIQINLGK